MEWKCQPGSCLLVPSGPGDYSHLFTIALGPLALPNYGAQEHVVMVSVTSIRADFPYDHACVLTPQDHAFLVHDSYVYYREPRVERVSHVCQMVASGTWKAHEGCSKEVLDRIIEGFKHSKRVPRYIRALFTGHT